MARSIPDIVTAQMLGAIGDGISDDTAALNNLVQLSASTGKKVRIPAGVYLTTDEILVNRNRTHIEGDGQQASIIRFRPNAANKAAFRFDKSAGGILVQPSLRGLSVDSAGDLSGGKVALNLIDCEEVIVDDFSVSNFSSDAHDCIGIKTNGRQTHGISNITINADAPLVIGKNPNHTIDFDHYNFHNCYLIAHTSQPNVRIEDGVHLSNVSFTGYQAWALGSDGLQWLDATAEIASLQLSIANVRWEQSTNADGHLLDIDAPLQGLRVQNCYGGNNTLGVKLRRTTSVTIANSACINSSGHALDVDETVQPLILDNFFGQTGSTVSVGNLRKVFDSGKGSNGGSIGSYVIYQAPTAIQAVEMGMPLMGPPNSIAQDAAVAIGTTSNTTGWLFVVTGEDVGAIYFLKGPTTGAVEVADPANFFSPTKDTTGQINLYSENGNFYVQNRRTGAQDVRWLILGAAI